MRFGSFIKNFFFDNGFLFEKIGWLSHYMMSQPLDSMINIVLTIIVLGFFILFIVALERTSQDFASVPGILLVYLLFITALALVYVFLFLIAINNILWILLIGASVFWYIKKGHRVLCNFLGIIKLQCIRLRNEIRRRKEIKQLKRKAQEKDKRHQEECERKLKEAEEAELKTIEMNEWEKQKRDELFKIKSKIMSSKVKATEKSYMEFEKLIIEIKENQYLTEQEKDKIMKEISSFILK